MHGAGFRRFDLAKASVMRVICLVLVAMTWVCARSAAAAAQSSDEAAWRCAASRCVIVSDVRNDDTPKQVAIKISIVLDRISGKLTEVLFQFPHYKRGASFGFGFVRPERLELVKDANRTLTIDDCDQQGCHLLMPKGVLAARDAHQDLDVGELLLTQDQALMIYASKGGVYKVYLDLYPLQAAYQTITGHKIGEAPSAADAELGARIEQAEALVKAAVTIKLTQNQFDGLVSFAMSAPEAFTASQPFLIALNRGDLATATKIMLEWNKVRDKKTGKMSADPALTARRKAERDIILNGIYEPRLAD